MESAVCHLGLILSILYSAAATNDISRSNNVTLRLQGIFDIVWEWKPTIANCSLKYIKEMKSIRNGYISGGSGNSPNFSADLQTDKVDLNYEVSLYVQTICNNLTVASWSRTVQLAPGDEETAVKNFSCVWHYQERVACTWRPGPRTPPDVNYRVHYWIKNSETQTERLYTVAEFWDLIDTGMTCVPYSSDGGKTFGCQFLLDKRISDFFHLAMAVTDAAKIIKPYIYHVNTLAIAKLKPPTIIKAYRTENNNIELSWNLSHVIKDPSYELLLTPSSSKKPQHYEISPGMPITEVLPDVTYTIQLRVKLPDAVLPAGNSFMWSEWTQPLVLQGKDDKLISLIIALIISALVITAAIFILVYMERLKVLICPQIPDPARMFPKDMQQWLKHDEHIVCSKEEKEEICPVYLIEHPTTMKCV